MRYVRAVLVPEDGLHPVDSRLAAAEGVTRELLHNINLLDDGTVTVLYELSGDVERIREIADNSPEIIDYQLSVAGERVTAYAHVEASQVLTDLMELLHGHELIVDMPLEFTRRGGLRVLVIGSDETIREVAVKVPDSIRLSLEQMGQYEPESERLFSQLTERQQETLLAALEVGYYEVPRQATHKDVAEYLGRSDGTVGEHLRKIEKQVFSAIAPR